MGMVHISSAKRITSGQPGDDDKTRSTGKHKKNSTSRTSKIQQQLNATNGKVQKLRRANAALPQQLRGDASSRGPAASSLLITA